MKKNAIRGRKMRYGGITIALTVLVIAVAVLANAVFSTLAKRYSWYNYMVREGTYEVTDRCYALLEEAFEANPGSKVEVIFCDIPTKEGIMEDSTLNYVYQSSRAISDRFADQVTLTCHDIWTNPTSVKQYKTMINPITREKVEVNIKSTSVILVGENFHRVYDLTEFFVFEDGDTSKVWAYDGEKKLSAGIIRAIRNTEEFVCLTTNHGETFSDYELLYLLDDAGYTISYIDLHKDPIPDNCSLIISFGPTSDIVADSVSATSEIEILEDYLSEDGNSLYVLMENGSPSLPNLERFLEDWGVDFCYATDPETKASYRYMVQDTSGSLTSDGYTIYGQPVETGRSGQLLEALSRPVIFKNATAITAAQGFVNNGDGSYTKGDRTLYSLYQSGENSACWTNGKMVYSGNVTLMSLSEQKNASGSSYVGVVTSTRFLEEEFLQSAVYGNTDAMMRSFEIVGKELTTEGLTIKPFASTDISTITTAQMLRWTIGLSITPAILITVLAVVILVRRRRA